MLVITLLPAIHQISGRTLTFRISGSQTAKYSFYQEYTMLQRFNIVLVLTNY
jgi:hypothetical protein